MRAGVAAVLAGALMLALPAGAGAQGADTTCQFALTRLDATTTNVLAVDILLDNEDGEAFRDDAASRCGNGPGFLSNRDIAYVFAPTSRGFGDLLVLRGRAPTFADTRAGPAVMPSGQQLRYWSFCQYEPATQRVIDCRSDDRVSVGGDGQYTIVVSTPEDRPALAGPGEFKAKGCRRG